MKLATGNVNSVRARLERLLAWLQKVQPDIVCLQELKARKDAFPYDAIREAGYHAAVYGQPTFNGVGILSRVEPQNIRQGMEDGAEDPQARFITAQVGEIQVISAYIPNGQVVGSEPYSYKLAWLRRLRAFLEKYFTPQTPLVVCGDFNVARDHLDVADPAAWEETVLYHPTSRAALEELLSWGLVDVHRQQHPEGRLYSWWDYRMLAFLILGEQIGQNYVDPLWPTTAFVATVSLRFDVGDSVFHDFAPITLLIYTPVNSTWFSFRFGNMGDMREVDARSSLSRLPTAAHADGLSTFRGDIMDTGATPDLISQLLAQTFSELGATGSVVRMFLLCDRQFIGQRFRCEKVQAVKLAGKDEIEFYDQAGELLKTVNLEETEKKSAV